MRKANWKDRVLFLIGRRRAFRVDGNSMSPTLMADDVVLIDPHCATTLGDIVLAEHPYKQNVKILKRVGSIDDNGRVTLLGDNPEESTDSRSFGSVSHDQVLGKVVCRVGRNR